MRTAWVSQRRPWIDEGGITIYPYGTVSSWLDREAGLLRIFSEPVPDPVDMRLAAEFARKWSTGHGGNARRFERDGIVCLEYEVFPHILLIIPPHDDSCPENCRHVNPYLHNEVCPAHCRHAA